MGRRKHFLEDYATDSDSSCSNEDIVLLTQDEQEEADQFAGGHRRKRPRTAHEAKESAALGVFASDSDDDHFRPGRGPGGRWKEKNLRNKGMGFVSAGQTFSRGAHGDDGEDEIDYEELARHKASVFSAFGRTPGYDSTVSPTDEGPEEEEEEEGEEGEEDRAMGEGGGVGGGKEEEEKEEEEEGEEEEEVYRPRLGLGGQRALNHRRGAGGGESEGASEASTPAHPGLGLGDASAGGGERGTPTFHQGPSFVSSFGHGFVSSASLARSAMPKLDPNAPSYEAPVVARPSAFTTAAATPAVTRKGKGKGTQPGPVINADSFAARMMAKMGYKAGEGLGKSGQGRLEPVAPKTRPQGVGVGAVREMSEQEKAEARRAAALRGEVLSDSESERESKARRRKKQAKQAGSAGSTPGGTPVFKKEKTKFRTAEEISASVEGLHVPPTLKSIVDFTGPQQRLLSSASGLMAPPPSTLLAADENTKLARMARRDLESFAGEWKGLQDRKAFIAQEELRLGSDIDTLVAELKRLQGMVDIALKLQGLSLQRTPGSEAIEALVVQIEVLQLEFKDEIDSHGLAELAVAALHPIVSFLV